MNAGEQEKSNITSPQNQPSKKVTKKKTTKKKMKRKSTKKRAKKKIVNKSNVSYPRHTVEQSIRIPQAILEQNAGRECTDSDAVAFVGLKLTGPSRMELSSSLKYGFLERPDSGKVKITDLAKKTIRPQSENEKLDALRKAILNAPTISDVYKHYRGENLPDDTFFRNALLDTFKIPDDKINEFKDIFISSLQSAQLLSEQNGKYRVLDISADVAHRAEDPARLKKLGKEVKIEESDTCFVMMPFAEPTGKYYSLIFEPAIKKAGLKPVRADDDMFTTGKIIDQIWKGIGNARVLVAELTGRNPNVYYELGLAHASDKPVVLVASNEKDVPFDLQHIRVIYYNMTDPFWGEKLIEKIAENILSALQNPEEAKFSSSIENEK